MTRGAHPAVVISVAVARRLHALGLVKYPALSAGDAAPCFAEDMPPDPDIAVAVLSRPSFPREYPNWSYTRPEFQVIVRHPGVEGARSRPGYSLCDEIRKALDNVYGEVWAESTEDSLDVFQCHASSSAPVPLGLDPQNRPRWSVSFQLEINQQEVSPWSA